MTLGKSRLASVARRQGVLIAFVLLVAFMFAATSTFGTYQNLINVLQQNSIIGIIACGMTFAIILGGFDLSVGSVTALASVVGATIMIDFGTAGIPIGIIGAVAACLFVGATNGWLIAYLGVNPFVATLGTMTVVRGLIYVATNASPRFGVPYSFTTLGMGRLFGVPNPAIVFLIVAASLGFVLHRTRFGHYVYAVGGNPVASSQRRRRFGLAVGLSVALWGETLGGGEQLAGARDVARSNRSGEEAVVANAMEAARQDVQEKAADELGRLERHGLEPVAAFDAVILPFEGYARVVEREEPGVRDGDAVGVAGEISEHGLRSGEGSLGVDDPCDRKAQERRTNMKF